MKKPFCVWKDVYVVGGAGLTHPDDCCVYLINCGDLVLIDTGAGHSFDKLIANIESLGFDSKRVSTVILTHAHIDHVGSAWEFNSKFKSEIIAHELDADAIESGIGIGAEYYHIPYHPCTLSIRLKGPEDKLKLGSYELRIIHIPGHTPGSVAVCVDMGKRILFGQDIHGPYFLSGADPRRAKLSLQKLLALRADILCEGHFSVIQTREEVKDYIKDYMDML